MGNNVSMDFISTLNFHRCSVQHGLNLLRKHPQVRAIVYPLQPLRREVRVMPRQDRSGNPPAEGINVSVRHAQLAHLGAEPVAEHLGRYLDAQTERGRYI